MRVRRTRAAAVMLALAMAGPRASADDRSPPRLAPCPKSPNCVSSLAPDDAHRVAPFRIAGDPARAWRAARAAVQSIPRTRIAEERPDYLRAECTSRLFRFVDDLELALDLGAGRIEVRSASRTGYGDLGVNRARVEALREQLVGAGALKAGKER